MEKDLDLAPFKKDPYKAAVAHVLQKSPEEVTQDERFRFKRALFAIVMSQPELVRSWQAGPAGPGGA